MTSSSASPLSFVSPPGRAFVALDDRLLSGRPGTLFVRVPPAAQASVLAHAVRRLQAVGFTVLESSASSAPTFHDMAREQARSPSDPRDCAEILARRANAIRLAIVVRPPAEGSWDHAVVEALLEDASQALVVFVGTSAATFVTDEVFELPFELTADEKLRWMGAVAEEAQAHLPTENFADLERWWNRARQVDLHENSELTMFDDAERELLAVFALVGRALPVSLVSKLGEGAIATLVQRGAVRRTESSISLVAGADASTVPTSNAKRTAASLLSNEFEGDSWAHARAAELLLAERSFADADAAMSKALRGLADEQAATEISARWFDLVTEIDGHDGLDLRIRAARRALDLGEAAEAQRWCESARDLGIEDPLVPQTMALALMQLGDLVAAGVLLRKVEASATSDEERATVSSDLAELAYLSGNHALAKERAELAVSHSKITSVQLAGRNVLGKLLLAQAKWSEADEHFAEDAVVAASAGQIAAELRARLNRGIALMSKGDLAEAKELLMRVHVDGSAAREDRACAYAYANLGVVAYRLRDYSTAVSVWERAIRYRRSLRGRVATAHTISNVAQLRCRLGALEHAEHTVTFGQRTIEGVSAPAQHAQYKLVSAQIMLARGDTSSARREIESALRDAERAHAKEVLTAIFATSARIALEDGDVARATHQIESAIQSNPVKYARAELALLRAMVLRAQGAPSLEAAHNALALLEDCPESEEVLLIENHTLLAAIHSDEGRDDIARAHCASASSIRDRMAGSLVGDLRASFLAKPEVRAISTITIAVAQGHAEAGHVSVRTSTAAPSRQVAPEGPRVLVGDDPQIRALLAAITRVARANSTVLIRGESGTGKELVAEALHRASDRAHGPLVSVNCAALVESLLLSELFGHEKGAFTGASSRRRGRFELAEGGTLFLDEIGDISARTQVALLRVLQERTFERVGGTTPIQVDVRVVCATHRDLRAMVERGEFREDLYYRLRGITLEVPSLRTRLGDLPKICHHLLIRVAAERGATPKTLTIDALELLARHKWPGNVRELENVLRTASLFADGAEIDSAVLLETADELRTVSRSNSSPPLSLRSPAPSACVTSDEVADDCDRAPEVSAATIAYLQLKQGAASLSDLKRQIERDCIVRALLETKGNITRAAALLGMKRPRLSQLVKQYGLSQSEGYQ